MSMNTTEAKVPNTEGDWQSIEIFLFSNGQQYSPPRKYNLRAEELNWWDATLNHLARSQYGIQHPMIYLYTTDGRLVEGPLELKNGMAYVAVEPEDQFIDTGYEKYLIRATRSWEKRQARKKSKVCEHEQPCCVCAEKEDCKIKKVMCCLCLEGVATAEGEQNLMAATAQSGLRTSGGPFKSSVLAKAGAAESLATGYGIGSGAIRLDEQRSRPGEYRASQGIHRASQGESGEQRAKPIDDRFELGEAPPWLGEDHETRSDRESEGEHGCMPSKNGARAGEQQLKSYDRSSRQDAAGNMASVQGTRPSEHGTRLSEKGAGSDEGRTRATEFGGRSNKQSLTPHEYSASPGKGGARPGEHKARPHEYEARPTVNNAGPADYEVGTGEEGPWPVELWPGMEEPKFRPGESETSLGENGVRSGEGTVQPRDHGPRQGKYYMPEVEANKGENGPWVDEYGSTIAEQGPPSGERATRLGEGEIRSGERSGKSGKSGPRSGGTMVRSSEHGAKSSDRKANPGSGGTKVDDHAARFGGQAKKSGEHSGRPDEHDTHGNRSSEYEARPADYVTLDVPDARVGENRNRGGEPSGTAGEQRTRETNHGGRTGDLRGRVADRGPRGGDHEDRAGDSSTRRDDHGARAGLTGGGHETSVASPVTGINAPPARTTALAVRASPGPRVGETGSRVTQGARVGEAGARVSPGTRVAESTARASSGPRASPGARVSPGGRASPGSRAGVPGTRVGVPRLGDPGTRVGDTETRVGDPVSRVSRPETRWGNGGGGGGGAAGFPHISEAQQHVRRSNLSTGKPSTEKKRWPAGLQPAAFRRPTPYPPMPRKTEDKENIKSNKESPTKKMSGKAPVKVQNGAAINNEVGKPKVGPKYPYKQFASPTAPPPTANFNQTIIKRKSTSLTKITSIHKSLATDSAPVENVIGDKEIIVVSTNLYKNPETEITSMRLDLGGRHVMEDIVDSPEETQIELINIRQSITSIPVNEEVQTYVEHLSEENDKHGIGVCTNCNVRVIRSATSLRDNMVATEDLDDNYISIIDKGDVVNLKLNIEVRNGERSYNSNQKYYRRSRSLTNVTRTEKGSQMSFEDELCVQSKSLQSLINNECCRGSGFEGRPKVVVVQCACCGQRPNNPPGCEQTACNDSKKYFVVLPNSRQEDNNMIDERCSCDPACQAYRQTRRQVSSTNPIKKTISNTSLETMTVRELGWQFQKRDTVTTTNSSCQTEDQKSEYLVTKHKVSITEDPSTRCYFHRGSSSQVSVKQDQYIMTKSSVPGVCPQECLQASQQPGQQITSHLGPQFSAQVCSPVCQQACPKPVQVQSQGCSQPSSQGCQQIQSQGCQKTQSQGFPRKQSQTCQQNIQSQGLPRIQSQACTPECPQVQSQGCKVGCPRVFPQVCDSHTQTDWCSVLLEARRHEDGRYSFHLPPLHVLRYYTF